MDEGYTIRRHVIRSCDSLRVVHETKVSVNNDDYLTVDIDELTILPFLQVGDFALTIFCELLDLSRETIFPPSEQLMPDLGRFRRRRLVFC